MSGLFRPVDSLHQQIPGFDTQAGVSIMNVGSEGMREATVASPNVNPSAHLAPDAAFCCAARTAWNIASSRSSSAL
jgi:hypothetical protein